MKNVNTTSLETATKNFEFKIASLTITPDTIMTVLQHAMEAVEVTTLEGVLRTS